MRVLSGTVRNAAVKIETILMYAETVNIQLCETMKTLYVSDLDGTLLNSNSRLSEYTVKTLNELINNGMCFSYATARSITSAAIVTQGLITNMPVITFNGIFIVNPNTGEKLSSHYFTGNQNNIIMDAIEKFSMFPLVYSYINGEEKVSWITGKENVGIRNYLDSRKGDKRLRPVSTREELYRGEPFTFICIGLRKELIDVYHYFNSLNEFSCYFQPELYREEYWLEIMPKNATKGNAIVELRDMLKCERIISFGDAINDISMFQASDECYAVENAVQELKEIATRLIGSNDSNGVAEWLKMNIIKT